MQYLLRILRPEGAERTTPLADANVTIGRVRMNDLSFPEDSTLSRQHFMLVKRDDGTWAVRDLGTRNGTRVNGDAINGDRELVDGDIISAGHVILRFEASGLAADLSAHETVPGPISADPLHAERTLTDAMQAGPAQGSMELLVRVCRQLLRPGPKGWYGVILSTAMRHLRAERGALLILEDGELTVRASAGPDLPISSTIRDRVLRQRVSIFAVDVRDDSRFHDSHSLLLQGVSSIIAAPLQTEKDVHGLLYLHKTEAPHFTIEDLNTATVLTHLAAVKREEELLVERERRAEKLADARRRALEAAELMRHAETRAVLAESAASLGRLAAAVSHEINSPIGALNSSVDTLLRTIDKLHSAAGQPRYLELAAELCTSIQASVHRLNEIAARLRRVTNLDRADVQQLDLPLLLRDVAQIVPLAEGATLEIVTPDKLEIVSRPQVLSAVFTSMFEFCREDGAHVVLTADADLIRIQVRQPARVLAEADLLHLFDPAFRSVGDKIGTANWELFSARQMVRELGGELYAESTEERGTVLTAELRHAALDLP